MRYIAYTPETDGTLYAEGKLNASGGRWGISDSRDVASFSAEHSTTSTDTQTVSMECEAGTEYYIYAKTRSATVTRVTYVSDADTGPTEETEPTEEPERTAEPTEETKPGTDPSANTAPDAPSGLLTNELEEPLNVDTAYFGWLVNDADENDHQSAYRIIVTDDLSGETAWDSGKTESSEQSYIECGAELERVSARVLIRARV